MSDRGQQPAFARFPSYLGRQMMKGTGDPRIRGLAEYGTKAQLRGCWESSGLVYLLVMFVTVVIAYCSFSKIDITRSVPRAATIDGLH